MNKKYNYLVLEAVARKAWQSLLYEDIVEHALLERKISFLFEAEEGVETITSDEMASVEEQAKEALSDLEGAIQIASEIFGDNSNTVKYLLSLEEEAPTETIDVSGDADPQDIAKKIAQKTGTTAQIQKVVASISAAIKLFGEELTSLPLEKMGAELQKLPDDAEVKTDSGNVLGKDLKEKWASLSLGDLADIAEEVNSLQDVEIDWSAMPDRKKMSSAAAQSFKMEEPSGFLGKILSFFGMGGYDKKQFSEDMLKVTLEKLQEKYTEIPSPKPADSQEANQTATELEGELNALNKGDHDAMPPPLPGSQDAAEAEEEEPEEKKDSADPGYKITPQDLKSIKASMETAKGKKKSQSKAMGSYLNQALDQEIFEEQITHQYDVKDLVYYRLMRMAGLPED